jgi:hypothetical protein
MIAWAASNRCRSTSGSKALGTNPHLWVVTNPHLLQLVRDPVPNVVTDVLGVGEHLMNAATARTAVLGLDLATVEQVSDLLF